MLVLSRRKGEAVRVSENLRIVVLDVTRGRVKLGFAGPRELTVEREEVYLHHQEKPGSTLHEILKQRAKK